MLSVVKKFFWSPEGCHFWGSYEKCVSGYWDLILRNEDGLEVVERLCKRKKAGCSTRTYLVPWQWGQRVRRGHSRRSATDLGM